MPFLDWDKTLQRLYRRWPERLPGGGWGYPERRGDTTVGRETGEVRDLPDLPDLRELNSLGTGRHSTKHTERDRMMSQTEQKQAPLTQEFQRAKEFFDRTISELLRDSQYSADPAKAVRRATVATAGYIDGLQGIASHIMHRHCERELTDGPQASEPGKYDEPTWDHDKETRPGRYQSPQSPPPAPQATGVLTALAPR